MQRCECTAGVMNHVDVSVVCILQNPKDDGRHRLRIIGNQDSLSCVHDEHPCEAIVQQCLWQRPIGQLVCDGQFLWYERSSPQDETLSHRGSLRIKMFSPAVIKFKMNVCHLTLVTFHFY